MIDFFELAAAMLDGRKPPSQEAKDWMALRPEYQIIHNKAETTARSGYFAHAVPLVDKIAKSMNDLESTARCGALELELKRREGEATGRMPVDEAIEFRKYT